MNKEQTYVYAYFFDPKTELWVDIKSQLFTDELGVDYDHPALLKANTCEEGSCNYYELRCQYEQDHAKYFLAKASPKLMQEFIYGYKLKPTWVDAKVETDFYVGDKFLDERGDVVEITSCRVIPYVDNLVHTIDTPVAMFCEDGVAYSLKNQKGVTMQGSTKHLQDMVKIESELVAELADVRYYKRGNGELIMQINSAFKAHSIVVHEGDMQNEVEGLLNNLLQVSGTYLPKEGDLTELVYLNK